MSIALILETAQGNRRCHWCDHPNSSRSIKKGDKCLYISVFMGRANICKNCLRKLSNTANDIPVLKDSQK